MSEAKKVGVVSCSGEELCEGTISRLAARRVLEQLRPDKTVTICLPLFLAGGEEERAFARNFPTITVDGCAKCCAKRGTEAHSGPVAKSLVVPEILGADSGISGEQSCRRLTPRDLEAVDRVAQRIAQEVDEVLAGQPPNRERLVTERSGGGCCGGSPEKLSESPNKRNTSTANQTTKAASMVRVLIFGAIPPCAMCKQIEARAKAAADKYGSRVVVTKLVPSSPEGREFGIACTPAVVVNGKLISAGKDISEEEIDQAIKEAMEEKMAKVRMEIFSGDPPCPGCVAILALADEYARKYQGRLEVVKLIGQEALAKFEEYKLFCVPAVVINEKIRIEGMCPDKATLDNALREGGL